MACRASSQEATTLAAPTLAKLIRLSSSDRDGEVVASIHAMRRVLASVGLSLHDLADAIELPDRTPQQDDWRVMAKACAQCPHLLSEREISFALASENGALGLWVYASADVSRARREA